MSVANRGLRSRAVKHLENYIPCAAGPRAAAPSKSGFDLLGRKSSGARTKIPVTHPMKTDNTDREYQRQWEN